LFPPYFQAAAATVNEPLPESSSLNSNESPLSHDPVEMSTLKMFFPSIKTKFSFAESQSITILLLFESELQFKVAIRDVDPVWKLIE
jgi:hypothetical protein